MDKNYLKIEDEELSLTPRNSGFMFSLAVVGVFISALIFQTIVGVARLETDSDLYLYLGYFLPSVVLFIAEVAFMAFTRTPLSFVGGLFNFSFKKRYIAVIALSIVAMLFGLSGLNDLFIKFLELFGYVDSTAALPDYSVTSLIICTVVIAILPPVVEEIAFRGIIQSGMKKSGYIAVIVTSAMFALYHFSPSKTAYQLVVGLLFSLIFAKSGSIIPTLVIHFLNNILIILNVYFGIFSFVEASRILFTVIGVCCLIGALAIIFTDGGGKQLKTSDKSYWSGFLFSAAIGLIIGSIVWIASLFA